MVKGISHIKERRGKFNVGLVYLGNVWLLVN